MRDFNIVKKFEPSKSFRAKSVIGQFDISEKNYQESFTGSLDLDFDWQIGVIVGNSGTGKTTIAKHLFSDEYIQNGLYKEKSVIDDMSKDVSVKEISKMFNNVGFSSVPSWLKPFNVLSNGEKMRVELANALLSNKQMVVFDEFTSVVDRDIARIGSYAVQRAVRKTDKKFIAVSCHYDILEWLEPDWVFDTNSMTFQKKSINDQKSDWMFLRQVQKLGSSLESIII